MTPDYDPYISDLWLKRGNIFVSANVRGGNEFGPKWHLQATKDGKQKTFDDLIAVAEDLIARGYSTKKLSERWAAVMEDLPSWRL